MVGRWLIEDNNHRSLFTTIRHHSSCFLSLAALFISPIIPHHPILLFSTSTAKSTNKKKETTSPVLNQETNKKTKRETYGIKDRVGSKVLDHGWEHVIKRNSRVNTQNQVVDKDKGGHGGTRLGLLGRLGVSGFGDDAGNFADLGVEEGDGDGVGCGDGERRLPVHEEVVVFREGNPGGHRC